MASEAVSFKAHTAAMVLHGEPRGAGHKARTGSFYSVAVMLRGPEMSSILLPSTLGQRVLVEQDHTLFAAAVQLCGAV